MTRSFRIIASFYRCGSYTPGSAVLSSGETRLCTYTYINLYDNCTEFPPSKWIMKRMVNRPRRAKPDWFVSTNALVNANFPFSLLSGGGGGAAPPLAAWFDLSRLAVNRNVTGSALSREYIVPSPIHYLRVTALKGTAKDWRFRQSHKRKPPPENNTHRDQSMPASSAGISAR